MAVKQRPASLWPANQIEYRRLDRLTPYARNARTHSPAQIAQIAASIHEWGWTMPCLVDETDMLLAGHARVLAAQMLKLTEAPVIVARGWDEPKKRAYILADNKLSLNAGWDGAMLAAELAALAVDPALLELTGFSALELAELGAGRTEGLTDPDDVPDVQPDPITRRGDLWIMGRHRLMCADSTSPDDVARLMDGKLADLCFTSPPYGQQRDYKSGGIGDWDTLMQGVFGILPVTHEAQVLVNLGMIHRDGEWTPYWDGWIDWMRTAGWRRFGWYVWDQGPGLPGDWNGRLAPSHEWVFHFNRVAERARKTKAKLAASIQYNDHGNGMRRKDGTMSGVTSPEKSLQTHKVPDSVIRVMRHKARGPEVTHPAVFPVDLVSEMLTAFSDPDDTVYEPFCGSGTQLISAQKNGRTCYAMELAPAYTDVAVRRWQAFSGQSATLSGTDQSFAAIEAERQAA